MGKYLEYIATDDAIASKLQRRDLQSQAPGKMEFLNRADLIDNFKCLERWEHVASIPNIQSLKTDISNARNAGNKYTRILASLQTAEAAISAEANLKTWADALNKNCDVLRAEYDFLPTLYGMANDIKDASRLAELFSTLNRNMESYDKRMLGLIAAFGTEAEKTIGVAKSFGDTAETRFNEAINAVNEKWQGEYTEFAKTAAQLAADTNLARESIKGSADQGQREAGRAKGYADEAGQYLAAEYLSSFSEAFNKEAESAEAHAKGSLKWAVVTMLGLIAGLGLLTLVNGSGGANPTGSGPNGGLDVLALIKWLSFRIVGAGILFYLVLYFLRDRRNFLHIASANRHRRNICNAYLAVHLKFSEAERLKYLQEIMPHLATLGKTGFITKESVPETKVLEALRKAIDRS